MERPQKKGGAVWKKDCVQCLGCRMLAHMLAPHWRCCCSEINTMRTRTLIVYLTLCCCSLSVNWIAFNLYLCCTGGVTRSGYINVDFVPLMSKWLGLLFSKETSMIRFFFFNHCIYTKRRMFERVHTVFQVFLSEVNLSEYNKNTMWAVCLYSFLLNSLCIKKITLSQF